MLRVEFQYLEFLPSDSSLYQWFSWHKEYFPGKGEMGTLYFSDMDVHKWDFECSSPRDDVELIFLSSEMPTSYTS